MKAANIGFYKHRGTAVVVAELVITQCISQLERRALNLRSCLKTLIEVSVRT